MGLTTCLWGSAVVVAALSGLVQLKLYNEKWSSAPDPYSYQWRPEPGATFDRTYPQVFRNPMDLGECRKDQEDACNSYWVDRFTEFFGDREVDVIDQAKLVDYVNETFGQFPEEFLTRATIRQYLHEDRFNQSELKFGTGIGTPDEFRNFFGQQSNGHWIWDRITQDPFFLYIGSQLFVSRNKEGTTMHNANTATTLFLNMGGRKRWVLADPTWMDEMDCVLEERGNYHTCLIPTRPHTDIDTQVRMMKHKGIPESAYWDVTLDPGDILLFGSTYPHAIDNLTPVTIGYSLRLGTPPARLGQVRITLRGLLQGLKLRLQGYDGTTMFDNIISGFGTNTKFAMADAKYRGGQNPVYRKYKGANRLD
jgi:hypothetical protein